MTLEQQIEFLYKNKKYCKVKRQVGAQFYEYSYGYIVDKSEDFLVMQETEDFKVLGYMVFPKKSVVQIRYNNNDKYYNKIMELEKLTDFVSAKHKIDLTNWTTIFKTIKNAGFNVIIENENPDDDTFDIGPIIRTSKTAVTIQYFNAKGYLDKEPTRITFDKITLVKFDDHYINIFSKHLRQRKPE
ncbi:MAG TPA: hypothetical protein VK202_12280 [Bacteroidia bacterium]|nr:hypothetical protein [Bacteroidia bacterium]